MIAVACYKTGLSRWITPKSLIRKEAQSEGFNLKFEVQFLGWINVQRNRRYNMLLRLYCIQTI